MKFCERCGCIIVQDQTGNCFVCGLEIPKPEKEKWLSIKEIILYLSYGILVGLAIYFLQ